MILSVFRLYSNGFDSRKLQDGGGLVNIVMDILVPQKLGNLLTR
jgi:hypothetical protein